MKHSATDAVDAELFAELEAVAIDVARAAARHVVRRRPELFGPVGHDPSRRPPENPGATGAVISTKSTPTDPVTVADTETEDLIRTRLRLLRPDDDVLGEEEGGAVEVPAGIRWVVDPIDGTVNFMYGIPAYAVSVAAQRDGVSVAGAVVDVARDVVYSAARGQGAFIEADGSRGRIGCTDVTDVGLALVATGFAYGAQRRRRQGQIMADLVPRVRDLRRIGAAALDLCMVAAGHVDAHIEHGLSPWDWAAGALIAEEAGAVVRTPPANSRSADGVPTIAVAPGIAADFLALLDEVGALEALPE